MRHYILVLLLVFFHPGLEAQQHATTVHVYGGVSGAYNIERTYGYGVIGSMKYSKYRNAGITVGAALQVKQFPRLALRVAVNYQPTGYDIRGRDAVLIYDTVLYMFDSYQFTPSLTLLYNFIDRGQWRVYAGGGAGLNLTKHTRQESKHYLMNYYTLNEVHMGFKKAWFSEELKVGATFKQFDLNFNYIRGRTLSRDEGIINHTAFAVNLNYLFKL